VEGIVLEISHPRQMNMMRDCIGGLTIINRVVTSALRRTLSLRLSIMGDIALEISFSSVHPMQICVVAESDGYLGAINRVVTLALAQALTL
jgi:hypothetical protein